MSSIKELKQQKAVIEVEHNGVVIPHISTVHLILKYRFTEGQTLTSDQYKTFIKDNEFTQLYDRALSYISYQMRTISEVKKQLKTKVKDDVLIQKVIDELKRNRYLSDSEYVKEYVTEKLLFDTVVPMYIKEKLIRKGIHYDLIDAELIRFTEDLEYAKIEDIIQKEIRYTLKKPLKKVLESLKRKCISKGFHIAIIDSQLLSFKEDIMAMIDESGLLVKELKQSTKQLKSGDYEEKQKVIKKLLSKGYSYEAIKNLIN